MSTTTIYDVSLRYRLDNQASAGTKKLAADLHDASKEASGLGSMITKLGMAAVSYVGIKGAYHAFVDFNKEVENAKIGLTAMVEAGFGGTFDYAKAQAESLYKEFQKFSTQTPVTTQEMLEFSRGVFMATQQAGGGINDVIEVTEKGVIAAKAYGFEAHLASREIAEMLQGNISNRQPFTKVLMGTMHKTAEEMRAMTENQRLELLKATFNKAALTDATSSFSTAFSGVTSTFKDKVQIALGKIGLPLFQAITAEVGRWNQWIDKNEVKLAQIGQTVGSVLVTSFGIVKDVFSFIYDHADTLLEIGKVYAAIRIGGMIGNAFGGMRGMMMGGMGGPAFSAIGDKLAGGLRAGVLSLGLRFPSLIGPMSRIGSAVSGLGGAAGALGPGGILGIGFAAHELGEYLGVHRALTQAIDPQRAKLIQLTESMAIFDDATLRAAHDLKDIGGAASTQYAANSKGQLDIWRTQLNVLGDVTSGRIGAGMVGGTDKVAQRNAMLAAGFTDDDKAMSAPYAAMADLEKKITDLSVLSSSSVGGTDLAYSLAFTQLTDYQQKTLNVNKAQLEVMGYVQGHLAAHKPISAGEIMDLLRGNTADPEGKHSAISAKPTVNVTIHRIEVQSDDPDRMAFGMLRSFRDAAKNPSSALSAMREG